MSYHTKEEWRAYNARRYVRNKREFDELKRQPCCDCRGSFPPYVMEYDHVPERGRKKFNLGVAIGSRNITSRYFQEELKKCDLVCANCHRVRTHFRKQQRHSSVTEHGSHTPDVEGVIPSAATNIL